LPGTSEQGKIVVFDVNFSSHNKEISFETGRGRNNIRYHARPLYDYDIVSGSDDFYGMSVPSVMATLLRTFSQGMKVCFEIILIAVDGGA
jgi:hypothetical protein